jgi:hypothetical protein
MARGITESTEIKKRLKQKYGDKFKFSVTQSFFSGGSHLYLSVLAGNIPALTKEGEQYLEDLQSDEFGFLPSRINESEYFTPEFKKIAKEIGEIVEEIFQSDRHSRFVSYKVGSYGKPYELRAKKSSGKSTSTGGFFGDLVTECAGWQIFLKNLGDGRSVYNIVKKKETKPNKGDWNQIRGEIYTEGGFKWSPKTQTFQKWGGDLSKEKIDKVCEILRKYYVDDTPSTPEQQTPSSDLPEADIKLLNEFKEEIIITNNKVLREIGADAVNIFYEDNEYKQQQYIKKMISITDNLLKGKYAQILNYKVQDVRKHVFKPISDDAYDLLNNFLGLYGLYGNEIQLDFKKLYNEFSNSFLRPFFFKKNEESSKKEVPQNKSKEDIEKAIKGLQILANMGNENAKKAIKGLEILLKNA